MGVPAKKSEASPFLLVDQLTGREHPLFDGFRVGRATGDLAISDNAVSSNHCVFRWNGRALEIEDLGSRNGTFVGGKKIEPKIPLILLPGVVVEIGNQAFEVRAEKAEPMRATVIELASYNTQLEKDGIPAPSPKGWPTASVPRPAAGGPSKPAHLVEQEIGALVRSKASALRVRFLLSVLVVVAGAVLFFSSDRRPAGVAVRSADAYDTIKSETAVYRTLFASMADGKGNADDVALALRSAMIPKIDGVIAALEGSRPASETAKALADKELDTAKALRSAMSELAGFAETKQPWHLEKMKEAGALLDQSEPELEKLQREGGKP